MRVITLDGEAVSLPFCAYRLLMAAYIRLHGKTVATLGRETDGDGLRWTAKIVGKAKIVLSAEANPHKAARLRQRREVIETLLLDYKQARKNLLPGLEQTKAAGATDAQASFQEQIDVLDGKIKAGEMGLRVLKGTIEELETGIVRQCAFPYDEELFEEMQATLCSCHAEAEAEEPEIEKEAE